jgi:thiol:disulfide interchange protein
LGAALAGSILIALAAWSFQKARSTAGGGRVTVIATAVISLLLAIILPIRFADVASAAPGADAQAKSRAGNDGWQPYSEAKVAELNAAGRPLLINFTASWCLTCMVNERNAFSDAAVQEIFRNKNVTLMKGDWTNRDPAITKALADFGRAGVPLYVVYNSKPGSEPIVLPQILTASVVESAFADAVGGM